MNFEFVGQDGEAMQEDLVAPLLPRNENVEQIDGHVQEDNNEEGAVDAAGPIDLMAYLDDDFGAL